MITDEFRSYIETMQKYLEGYPVQSSYACSIWTDYIQETSDDCPQFDGDYWRVKPGEYRWVRLYRASSGDIISVCGHSKENVHNLVPTTWVSDPVLVKLVE